MSLAYAWQNITTTFINSAGISTTVAEITTVPSPAVKRDTIEVTSQDSNGFKEFIAGLTEGDEIEFVMNDVPSDAGQQALAAASVTGDKGTFILTFKNGRSVSFPVVVDTFSIEEKSDVAANSCKCKINGQISRSMNPAELTALDTSLSSLFPDFSPHIYKYIASSEVGVSNYTVTATCTDATITVNGISVASGVVSNTFPLSQDSITDISILVQKSGCSPVTYFIEILPNAAVVDGGTP